MKKITTAIILALSAVAAHAQSSSVAQQQSSSAATAQGTIQFSQNPADQHLTETVRNVPSVVMGAFAGSFSQMNCSSTAQAGMSVAGFGIAGGAAKDSHTCVLEVAAAELARQSTVDPENASGLRKAAIGVRCQISEEVYNAMQDAGFSCPRKPRELQSRTDTQPASTRVGP